MDHRIAELIKKNIKETSRRRVRKEYEKRNPASFSEDWPVQPYQQAVHKSCTFEQNTDVAAFSLTEDAIRHKDYDHAQDLTAS